jgi:phage baseplate assembly protein W
MADIPISAPTSDTTRRRLLGRGLRFEPGGGENRDLLLARNAAGLLDLALVDGIANLGQSLGVALTTPLGGDVFNLDHGFDGLNALADEDSPLLVRERVRVSIVNLLRKDARVRRIVDVKLLDGRLESPGTGALRRLDVRVVFETVSADVIALTTGSQGTSLDHG